MTKFFLIKYFFWQKFFIDQKSFQTKINSIRCQKIMEKGTKGGGVSAKYQKVQTYGLFQQFSGSFSFECFPYLTISSSDDNFPRDICPCNICPRNRFFQPKKIFLTKTFFTKNLFWPKLFSAKSIFRPKILFDQNFYLTKKWFNPKFFFD